MKIHQKLLIAFCSGLLFVSCRQQPETVYVEVPSLRPSSIYNREAVYWFSKEHRDDNQEMAEAYLRQAKEQEAQNLQKAIYFVKRSITLHPSLARYEYLANLLNQAGQYGEMAELYDLLVRESTIKNGDDYERLYLFGKPDEDNFYEFMAASFLDKKAMYGYYLLEAEELGLSRANLKKRFLSDSRIKLVPETETYKKVMLQFMSEEETENYIRSEENFRNFLASLKDTASVFAIDEKGVRVFNYEDQEYYGDTDEWALSDFYIHYLEEKQQKPNSWYTFNFNRRVRLNDSINAVLYAIDTSATACPAEMRHIYHRLVTYNRNGRIISSKIVALQSGEQVSTLSFTGNRFTVTDHRRTWKKPYNKNDFDNYVVKTEPVNTRNFDITGNGEIKEVELKAAVLPAEVTEM